MYTDELSTIPLKKEAYFDFMSNKIKNCHVQVRIRLLCRVKSTFIQMHNPNTVYLDAYMQVLMGSDEL